MSKGPIEKYARMAAKRSLLDHLNLVGGVALNWSLVEETSRAILSLYISRNKKIGAYFTHSINAATMETYFKEFVKPEKTNTIAVNYIREHFGVNRQNRNKLIHAVRAPADPLWSKVNLHHNSSNRNKPTLVTPVKNEDMERVVMEINDLKNCVVALHHWKTSKKCPCKIEQLPELRIPKMLNPLSSLES